MNYKKIFMSASVIAFVSALVFGGTQAFFSDTETSSGNTFAAGAIDLRIDNHAWYNGLECSDEGFEDGDYRWQDPENNAEDDPFLLGLIDEPCQSSWELKDLESGDLFFNLTDLKPGDWEEDTISFHVDNNDAWLCANLRVTEDDDVSSTEPELEDGDTEENGGNPWDGELGQELNFMFWADDGDNVLENDEQIVLEGTPSSLDGYGIDGNEGETFPLVDSTFNVWNGDGPLPAGNDPVYIGKAFCFGEVTVDPVAQGENSPAVNPGFTCNGEPVTNLSQTDRLMGDLRFYAVQSRNNEGFVCSNDLFNNGGGEGRPVGAALSNYVAPACDATVDDDNELANALSGASIDDTICLNDGTYAGPIDIQTEGLTLAGVNGPLNTATVNGGIIVSAPGVTITGLKILPGNTEGSEAGVYLKEAADGTSITYNIIDGTGNGNNPRGILNVIGTDIDDVLIENNSIHNLTTGVYTNPHTSDTWLIRYNDFDNNVASIGQWNGAHIVANEFTGGGEAIGVDNAWDANGGTITNNNFLEDTRLNTYTSIAGTIMAEYNFWSPNGAAAQVDDSNGTVDFTPETLVQFPHN